MQETGEGAVVFYSLEEGEYRPLPVSLDSKGGADITEKLAAITPVLTEFGLALILKDLLTAVIGRNQAISEWQTEQLIQNGRVSQALRQLGYQNELTWRQPLRRAAHRRRGNHPGRGRILGERPLCH